MKFAIRVFPSGGYWGVFTTTTTTTRKFPVNPPPICCNPPPIFNLKKITFLDLSMCWMLLMIQNVKSHFYLLSFSNLLCIDLGTHQNINQITPTPCHPLQKWNNHYKKDSLFCNDFFSPDERNLDEIIIGTSPRKERGHIMSLFFPWAGSYHCSHSVFMFAF